MLIAPHLTWRDGALARGIAVRVEDGVVTAVGPAGAATPDAAPHVLTPRPTDLQVNGGGGVLLNDEPTADGMRAIAASHRARGTGWILPTLITDAPEAMERAAEAVIACHGRDGVAGLHLEGPHIAPERRGIHDPALIRPLDARTLAVLRRLRAEGVPVLLTLAPERADLASLREIASLGVAVWAGHSEATAEEARAAFDAGVGGVTHLLNAMPPMLSRAPGLVGAALNSDAWCAIIADGHHVSWDVVAVACRARPRPGRTVLVSDAMPSVGGPDRFALQGRAIRLSEGRLTDERGTLAGAHLDMAGALANVHRRAGVALADAVAMAVDAPRAAMGLPPVAIAPGARLGDLLALDASLSPEALA